MDNQPGAAGSVGQVFFHPNSRNVLPAKVVFTIDIRAADTAKFLRMNAEIRDEIRYLLRDRDSIYGKRFRKRVKSLGITEVLTAPRSPWQNPYVERLIGSIRRECLNHVIVLNERHLRRQLRQYFTYYHNVRTHLSLGKQCPQSRAVQSPGKGKVIAFPHVGGLHHEYRRVA